MLFMYSPEEEYTVMSSLSLFIVRKPILDVSRVSAMGPPKGAAATR